MHGEVAGDTFAIPDRSGPTVQTPDVTDTVLADLRDQLAAATDERKRAASRARYLRHAIGNLEQAQARSGARAEVLR